MLVTLPSNSSFEYYPDNKLSSYKTQLAKTLHFDGIWDVGLAEITYVNSFHNLVDASISITALELLSDDIYEQRILSIKTGTYRTWPQLRETIKKTINDAISPAEITIKKDSITNLVKIKLSGDDPFIITFSSNLAGMLGFDSNMKIHNRTTYTADRPFDLQAGIYGMYLYTDIIDAIPVGDSLAPLLRIIDIEGNSRLSVTKTYNKIMYTPLTRNNINTISIELRDDNGQLIKFTHGKTIVTLSFKKRTSVTF